jgi:cell division protein FtsL
MTRVNLLLTLVVVVCALSLVTSRYQARKFFVDLEREQSRARAFEVEYGQLQLELSTWAAPARVEKVAREELKMEHPSAARIQVLPSAGSAAPTSDAPVAVPEGARAPRSGQARVATFAVSQAPASGGPR